MATCLKNGVDSKGQAVAVGDRVKLLGSREKGVVVHLWPDKDVPGAVNAFIAFFGNSFPKSGSEPRKPYVLRYWTTSLEVVLPPKRK